MGAPYNVIGNVQDRRYFMTREYDGASFAGHGTKCLAQNLRIQWCHTAIRFVGE
jgi:hypothetical protein